EVELAALDLPCRVEAAAVPAHRAELAGERIAGRQLVGVGRNVDDGAETGMSDGAVVALEEVLGDELPVRLDARFRPAVVLQLLARTGSGGKDRATVPTDVQESP